MAADVVHIPITRKPRSDRVQCERFRIKSQRVQASPYLVLVLVASTLTIPKAANMRYSDPGEQSTLLATLSLL